MKRATSILLLLSIGLFLSLSILAASFQLAHFNSPPIINGEVIEHSTVQDQCSRYNYSTCTQCTANPECGFCYDVIDGGACLSINKNETSRSLVGACNTTDQSSYTFTQSYCPNKFAWMLVLGMVLFMVSFAPGLGPIPWLVNSEIYPVWARGLCSSLTSALSWSLSLLVSSTFLTLTETISTYGTFWVFAGMCVVGFLFVLFLLPETKGKTLEEVEELFMRVRLLKEDSYRLLNNVEYDR